MRKLLLVSQITIFTLFMQTAQAVTPTFAAYPINNAKPLKPEKLVSFSQYPELKVYRSALLVGVKDGPNFAQNYTVVEVGCGTACQLVIVMDAKGNIVQSTQACLGADYRLNSRLLVINPPEQDPRAFGCQTEYQVLEDGKLQTLSAAAA